MYLLIPTRTTRLLFCLSVTIVTTLFLQCIDLLSCVVKSSQLVPSLVAISLHKILRLNSCALTHPCTCSKLTLMSYTAKSSGYHGYKHAKETLVMRSIFWY